ncbi:MAG: UDP-N-acetylmuramate dehydrogenase [Halieaceae bacterium]|nr:UDP-N-acetylmuramate dehydrogenase [Halieaceae bacterium]
MSGVTPQRNVSLRSFNTLGLESRAAAFVTVQSDSGLLQALRWAEQQKLPVVPMGEGSNVVLAGDLEALVLHQQTKGREVLARDGDSVLLRVAAGEGWHDLVGWCLATGYHGLENLALIPGTVGAAPVQNIGAYGVELASMIRCVHARSVVDGSLMRLDHGECEFGYRDSVFKHRLKDDVIITAVEFELTASARMNIEYPSLKQYLHDQCRQKPTHRDVYEAVVSIRRARLPDPQLEPNAGSFFKNPVLSERSFEALKRLAPGVPVFPQASGEMKIPAGWLIDRCGWKGRRQKNQGVHSEHALVLVNYGNSSGADLLAFAAEISDSVERTYGVALEIEPRRYGQSA